MAVILILLLTVSLTVSAFADPGSFVSSPSSNGAPDFIEGSVDNDGCSATIVVRAYSDRSEFSEEDRTKIEEAYASIVAAVDPSALNEDLAALAKELSITPEQFAVSELFDISYKNCEDHASHGNIFKATIEPKLLDNFACLMYFDGNQWKIVEEIEISEDGKEITFKADAFAPFAIVVHDGSAVIPQEDITPIVVGGSIAGVASLAGIFFLIFFLLKKKKSVEDIPVQ